MMSVVEELRTLMEGRGTQAYGERITIAEHCLLTALAAQSAGEPDTMILACLLHDVGHWLDEPDDEFGIYSHAEQGGRWVAQRFGPSISEPVRLHVEAKRYLCSLDPDYHRRLSPASVHTLDRQGGPMSRPETFAFANTAFHHEATVLRRLEDDHGKKIGAPVPDLDRFAPLLMELTIGAAKTTGSHDL